MQRGREAEAPGLNGPLDRALLPMDGPHGPVGQGRAGQLRPPPAGSPAARQAAGPGLRYSQRPKMSLATKVALPDWVKSAISP